MTRLASCVTLALPLLIASAVGIEAQEPSQPDAALARQGRAGYARHCAVCHGPTGRGDGPVAAGLETKPTDLRSLAAANGGTFPFDKVARAIDGREAPSAHGTTDKTVWGAPVRRSTEPDPAPVDASVARIAHYIWSIQRN